MKSSRKIREKVSVQLSKNPGRLILLVILLFNIIFVCVSALIINALDVSGTEDLSFGESVYYTITMILDAGCISNVVADIGTAGVGLVIACLCIIIIGMILFTGAVIGYLTNYISNFIDKADKGYHRIILSGHTVILNWNSRANEIVNDLMYCEKKQTVIILVNEGKEIIERELDERLEDTVEKERASIRLQAKQLGGMKGLIYRLTHHFSNNLTIIVREGNPYSDKQLRDISLAHAKTVIILGDEHAGSVCKYEVRERLSQRSNGNPQTIKALAMVSDITNAIDSDDNQQIVVESEDEWTSKVIDKIIVRKRKKGKSNIVPINENQILGQLLSQFSLMPELNYVYAELFSNKGMTFFSKPYDGEDEDEFIKDYLDTHVSSIPLSLLKNADGSRSAYYCADSTRDELHLFPVEKSDYKVSINYEYQVEKKNIVILGHNSKLRDIMNGFNSFRNEWNGKNGEILNIIAIDDKEHLKNINHFEEYPYVTNVIEADLYQQELICKTIEDFVESNADLDTSVLILSDDLVPLEEIDSGAITNLIYISDIIRRKKEADPKFDENKIDVVVEILNPNHYELVKSYSTNNVVISNRYISKMITQIGDKDSLFDFYKDILSYDDADAEDTGIYTSKEVYIKKVSRFFNEIPSECNVAEFIRAVYYATSDAKLNKNLTHSIPLGKVDAKGNITLFKGNQLKQTLKLEKEDKLILFADH